MTVDELLKSPDFSVDEINLGDYLDSVPFGERENALRQVLNKLNPAGQITLSGNDIGVLTSFISENLIDVPNSNGILSNIKSMVTLNDIDRWFYNNGFKVVKKNIEGFKYALSARYVV